MQEIHTLNDEINNIIKYNAEHNILSNLKVSDVVNASFRFLNHYYKGCFEIRISHCAAGYINISINKFARFVLEIFTAVAGNHLITLSADHHHTDMLFNFAFPVAYLTKSTLESLRKISQNSRFSFTLSDCGITVSAKLSRSAFSPINANTSTFVYNAFVFAHIDYKYKYVDIQNITQLT